MSEPTFVPLYTGDTHDDDPVVLDSLYESVTEGPTPIEDVVFEPVVERPIPAGRLVTGSLRIDPTWATPSMILPADTRRKHVEIRLRGTDNTDFVQVADESGKVMTETGAGKIYHGDPPLTFDDYTGAIHITAYGSPHAVIVSWWSVTR
jgi:hypothetical protein